MTFNGGSSAQASKELKAVKEQTAALSRDLGQLKKEFAQLKELVLLKAKRQDSPGAAARPRPDSAGATRQRPDSAGSSRPPSDSAGASRPRSNSAGASRPRPDSAGSSRPPSDSAAASPPRPDVDIAKLVDAKIEEVVSQQAKDAEMCMQRVISLEQESRFFRVETEAVRRLVQGCEAELARSVGETRGLLDREFQERIAACQQLEELFNDSGRAHSRSARPLQVVPEEDAMPCGSPTSQAEHDAIIQRVLQLEDAVATLAADHDGGSQTALLRLQQMQSSIKDCQTWLATHALSEQSVQDLVARQVQDVASCVENLRARVLDCESLCASAADFKETLTSEAVAGEVRVSEDLAEYAARLAALEETLASEAASSEARVSENLAAYAARFAALEERVARDEISADQRVICIQNALTADEGVALRAQVDLLADRLTACESRCSFASQSCGGQADLLADGSTACESRRCSVTSLSCGSQAALSSAQEERPATELSALRASFAKLSGEVYSRQTVLKDLVAQEQRAVAVHRSAMEARLGSLEDALRESVRSCERGLTSIRSDHAKLSGEAKARDICHAGMEIRLTKLQEAFQSSAEEHARGASTTSATLEQLQRRLGGEAEARSENQCFVRELLSKEKEERSAETARLLGRLEKVEQHTESPARFAWELQAVQRKLRMLSDEAKEAGSDCRIALERLNVVENVCREFSGHASAASEGQTGGSFGGPEVSQEVLDQQHLGFSERVKALEQAHIERHRSLADRVCILEQVFQNSVTANTRGVRDTQARLEKMQSKWTKVRKAWDEDLGQAEATLSDTLSISQHGWETNSQCCSWASEDPMAAPNFASTTMAGDVAL